MIRFNTHTDTIRVKILHNNLSRILWPVAISIAVSLIALTVHAVLDSATPSVETVKIWLPAHYQLVNKVGGNYLPIQNVTLDSTSVYMSPNDFAKVAETSGGEVKVMMSANGRAYYQVMDQGTYYRTEIYATSRYSEYWWLRPGSFGFTADDTIRLNIDRAWDNLIPALACMILAIITAVTAAAFFIDEKIDRLILEQRYREEDSLSTA